MPAPLVAVLALLTAAAPPAVSAVPSAVPDAARAEAAALRALAVSGAGEPPIERVQAAAAWAADAGASDVSDFPRRARLAGLLPRITAEVRREEQSNRVVGLQGTGEVDYLRLAPSTAVVLKATWDLGTLLAAPGEVAAGVAAATRQKRRADAVMRATTLYYERRTLAAALLLEPPADAVARARAELQLDRLGAELDALTGGAFTARGR